MKNALFKLASPLLACAATLLVACGDSPEQRLSAAKALLDKDDAHGAVIQVKGVLQAQPNSAEARYLLGKALLEEGNPSAASLELRKALDLQYSEDAVVPELARAILAQRHYQELLDKFKARSLPRPEADADLKVSLALAYAATGQRDLARQALGVASSTVPGYLRAKLVGARLQADAGDVPGALAAVDRLLTEAPANHEAWQLKGDLLKQGPRDFEQALVAYRKALELKPKSVLSHSAILTLLLGKPDLEAARAQLTQLRSAAPAAPQVVFYTAYIALMSSEVDKALELTQKLLQIVPNDPQILQLAGAIEFEKRAYLKAEAHLAKAIQIAPEQDVSRRLLALTYLRLTQPAKTLNVIQPLLERPAPGATAYALAAQAHLQAGDLNAAEAAYAEAAKLQPGDTKAQAAVAISKVLKGNTDTGITELRALAAADNDVTADIPLIGALVRKNDFDGALKAIDGLERKQPDKPIAANLRARVLMHKGDREAARAAFQRAFEIQPTFYPAVAALAQFALLDGKSDEAQRLLEGALKHDPKNMQALLAMARLKAATGADRDEVIAVFTKAVSQSPADPLPRQALINYQLANREFKAALENAQAAVAAIPNQVDLVDALGRAQAATGDRNQALISFNKLAQLTPQSPVPYLRLADMQWAAGERESALGSLKRALAISPQNLQAMRSLVDIHLAGNKIAEAANVAREIQRQRPRESVGYMLEGAIEASQNRWPAAVKIYNAGLVQVPDSTELATRLHIAYLAEKKSDLAAKHVAAWVANHPKDAEFEFYLGDYALTRKDHAAAKVHYGNVLKLQPENALATNNVAWLMAKAREPGAVAMAEKAARLLPNRPLILDTLAYALSSEGKPKEAIVVLRKALALEPKNPQLRFNVAKLLIDVGDKAAAKTELQALAELGAKYPRQNEVAQMLKSL